MQKALATKRSRNNAGRSREDGNASHLLVDANTTGNFNVNRQFGAYESYAVSEVQSYSPNTMNSRQLVVRNKDEKKNAVQFPEISQGN